MHSEEAERRGQAINNQLLKQLYQKYYREIYLYLYSLCQRCDLAEDLAQETFLKALLSLSDSHTNMRAWLYMVARNLFFNCRKKESRLTYTDEISEFGQEELPDPLTAVIQKEQTAILSKALNHLSGNKREVLIMHYFGGLPQNEIAEILGLTPANVRVLTLRAKKELKQYMEVSDNDIS